MKSLFSVLLIILTATAFSADDQRVKAGLFEVQSAQNQVNILFNEVSSEQKDRVRFISQKLALAENYLQQSLNQYPNPPPQEKNVELFQSDSCSGDLVAFINSTTDCSRLSGTESVWGIRANGRCYDVADTSLTMSCHAFKAANSQRAVRLYRSDSCNESLVAAIDKNTNCDSLAGLDSVWAVQVNNQCQDVSDIDVVTACKRFKP